MMSFPKTVTIGDSFIVSIFQNPDFCLLLTQMLRALLLTWSLANRPPDSMSARGNSFLCALVYLYTCIQVN